MVTSLRPVCNKAPFLEHSFSFFILMTYQTIYKSTIKLFADGTSLFSVVIDNSILANELNKDLQKYEWVYKCKISFNPDLNKQAQEVMYPRKLNNLSHQKNFFNITSSLCQLAKTFRNFFKIRSKL